jgi:glucose/arabinose dehydrogenase
MRVCLPHKRIGFLAGAVLLAACSTSPAPTPRSPAAPTPTPQPAAELAPVTVQVNPDLAQPPFDEPRQALIPPDWTLSVWARIPNARLAAWAPDGSLLVSAPSSGQVVRVEPGGAGPRLSVPLDGLDQPHGLAFAGSTLYVAESDQIDAYDYTNGAATNRRTVAAGLPDKRSPELHGAYAHALKSLAVGPDGAMYFSIGSTGNITVQDRDANPPRATIMRIPPGGGPAQLFATGVRNGTGLAVAPDGSVWTAVNNRDNTPDPNGDVDTEYVNEHPPEALARLTPGRELGWPFCNPDGGPADLPFIRDMSTNADGSRMDCGTLPPVEQSMAAHAAPLLPPMGCRSLTQWEPWSACTAHGTGSRRVHLKCPSFRGGMALWATSRLWSAGFRPTTDPAGAVRSRQ